MCGIAGFIAPKAPHAWRKRALRELLVQASTRGKAATGIAFVDPTKGLTVVKDGKSATEFVNLPVYTEVADNLPAIVIAHGRAATGGQIAGPDKNENNHPFYGKDSKIALIHNGTCEDMAWRRTVGKPDGISEKYDFTGHTDSELFLRVIETFLDDGTNPSMVDVISDAMFNIEGHYALAIVREAEPNKLWLVRHKNPLWLAYNEKMPFLVFGSTKEIITDALTEYSYKLSYFTRSRVPDLMFEEVGEDKILEITLLDKPNEYQELFVIDETKFEPHKETSHSYHGGA